MNWMNEPPADSVKTSDFIKQWDEFDNEEVDELLTELLEVCYPKRVSQDS